MPYSSLLGADRAPTQSSGRDAQALGPSDNSDSGSDAAGTSEVHGDSDAAGTGERGSVDPSEGREGSDILPDHVVRVAESQGSPAAAADVEVDVDVDVDSQDFTDLDAREPTAGEPDDESESR